MVLFKRLGFLGRFDGHGHFQGYNNLKFLWKRMLNNNMRKCSNSKNKTVGFFSLLMLVYGQNDQM